MRGGVLELNINRLRSAAYANRRTVTVEMILDFLFFAQKSKMDAHLIIGGQNGVGKSILMCILGKLALKRMGLPEAFRDAQNLNTLHFIYAYHKRKELEQRIRGNDKAVFLIDELRPFFDYKRHQQREQVELYNAVEIARSKQHIYIGCSRDYTKLDNNYRNAKAQLLIYIFDKIVDTEQLDEKGNYKTILVHGCVFVGNPALEFEDKFGFAQLRGYSLSMTKFLAEKQPTFVGNFYIRNSDEYGITKDDIELYESEKDKGIARPAAQEEEEEVPVDTEDKILEDITKQYKPKTEIRDILARRKRRNKNVE